MQLWDMKCWRWGAALGLVALALVGCGGSPSGSGTPVTGTFIDAPVQGLLYQPSDWTARADARKWKSITSSEDGSKLAAVDATLSSLNPGDNGDIYTSSDGGLTWTPSGLRLGWSSITSSRMGDKLAAVASNGYLYTSVNSGETWTLQRNAGNRSWRSITSSSNGTKLAAVSHSEILTSVNGGLHWTTRRVPDHCLAQSSVGTEWTSIASSANGEMLAATMRNGKIYTSTNGGASWTCATVPSASWNWIASSDDGTKLAAVALGSNGSNGFIYISTDSGANWSGPKGPQGFWRSITMSQDGTKLAAARQNEPIYTSSDGGETWVAGSSPRNWGRVTMSKDGTKIVATEWDGRIYTYSKSPPKRTGASGTFDCTTGQDVSFSLGNQVLGAVKCGEAVHVYHMAGAGDSVEKGVRVARLLQSLNTSSDSSKIVLPDLTGVTVNVRLDTNDTDFETDVLALMTALNGKGLVNTTPVTRATAVAHVQTELNKLSDAQKTNLCSTNHCNSELLSKLLNPAAVQVSVTGLTDGQTIDLQMVAGGSTQALKLLGKTGTTLSAGFVSVPTTGQTYTVSRSDTNGAISCTLGGNATGTYDASSAPTVALACSTNTPVNSTLGGTVSGLAGGQSVTLKNGSDSVVVNSSGTYLLPTAVTAGNEYRVEVSAQNPSNLKCEVANASGIAPSNVYSPNTSVVSNINVTCQVTGYSVGGTVTGLTSSDTLGLVLTSSDSNADKHVVSVTGSGSGAAYTFTNVTVASGSTFSLALDGAAPAGYTCTVSPTYATATTINANVTNADVVCGTATVTAITAQGSVNAGATAYFAVTGSNLPLTAILELGGVECTSASATASGFYASCTAPANAGTVNAQVKSDTAANSGSAIGSPVSVSVGSGGGGGGSATVTGITPQGSIVAGGPATFTVTGSNLPSTAILVLDGVECMSASATSSGFTAACMAPASAGTVNAQVKSNTAANSGTAIGSPVSVTVVSGGGGGGGSCGAPNTAAGSVGGYVTGLSGTKTQVDLISHDDTIGIDSETVTVVYAVGCTTQYFAFSTTPLMRTVRSNTAGCTVTNGVIDQSSDPSSVVSNVTVTCN